jgi:hypothetical protein
VILIAAGIVACATLLGVQAVDAALSLMRSFYEGAAIGIFLALIVMARGRSR